MLDYLDDQGVLGDISTRIRKRDGRVAYKVQLMGANPVEGSVRTTHTYLSGAVDVVKERDTTQDPRLQK